MTDVPDWLNNISDKETLQANLTFASLYIAVYEFMVDYVETSIRDFLCDIEIQDGKTLYEETRD